VLKLIYHEEVGLEIEAAYNWYKAQNPISAERFKYALYSILEEVQFQPQKYPIYLKDTRKAKFPRPFPFSVISLPQSAFLQ
jgi:hypothetical protein